MDDKKVLVKKIGIKVLIVVLILAIVLITYSIIYKTNSINDIFKNVKDKEVSLTEYVVYGTHLNLKGTLEIENENIAKTELCLMTINGKNLKNLELSYEKTENGIEFTTSNLINEGIDLEELTTNTYYLFVKVEYQNRKTEYYSIKNETEYDNIEYYTLTKNNRNNKVEVLFEDYDMDGKDLEYMYISVNYEKLPDNVYDVVIDPGHGGGDPGAEFNGYREADLALKYSLLIKEELEDLGLKVLITRDGTEDESFNTRSVYDKDGRINVIGNSKAKYVFAIHLNSINEPDKYNGVEIYAPTRSNLDFAKLFANNIVKYANTKYSNLEVNYRLEKGVYVRTFREHEIAESIETAKNIGFKPYDIKEYTPYLYIIRETGGIATGAYIDGRNKNYGTNLYYDSNIGIESYLLEIGYINSQEDLPNILSNEEGYVKGIVKTIKDKLLGEDYVAPERKDKDNEIKQKDK